ncbi:MAG: hypothetical protein PVF07_02650 [Thiogranum sp.]|jgi:hypothetical protein
MGSCLGNHIQQFAFGGRPGGVGSRAAALWRRGCGLALLGFAMLAHLASRFGGFAAGFEPRNILPGLLVIRGFVVVWAVDRTRRGLFALLLD